MVTVIDPTTDFNTRVSIKKGNLDMIGDSLRAHFGELKEVGTKSYYKGNGTKVLSTPNMFSLPFTITEEFSYRETDGDVEAPDNGGGMFEEPVYNPITRTLFKDHEWEPEGNWFEDQPLISSIQVHGAAYLKIKMTYIDNITIGSETNNVSPYTWIGGGLHAHASEVQGEYLPQSIRGIGAINAVKKGWGEAHCLACGAELLVNLDSEGNQVVAMMHPPYCPFHLNPLTQQDFNNTNVDMVYTGYNGPLIERLIVGDTFTLLWNVGRIPLPDVGHYIEFQAFDVNDNLMTEYSYTVNQVINEWNPANFSYQIDKLNNYPNAEEVKF